ncbi:hypothetical protein JKF63_06025 [Porcisia hertigi]|uniref:Uncharacterized protein n=1 Tax=Porcisia hertigi TaxID=2761500 RepID=A0A836IIZ2_9TRYP|nr:hypothetical protein JKF63_06025 [Porcisia hertigi]
MHVVSDLQQRPKKGRLMVEKNIVTFYDLCSLVQLVTFLIHTVTTVIGAKRTFTRNIMIPNEYELTPALAHKTRNCSYSTVRDIYAFYSVHMTLTESSANDIFVDHAIQMRLAIFVCAAAIVVGGLNRTLVDVNVFVIKFRNFYFWKDIISAIELLLLAYVIQIVATAVQPAHLLRDYLLHCEVKSRAYLPFVSTVNLWVFAGVGYLSYVVGLVLYLNNALPKYGLMTPQEIEEYKAWVRSRRAEEEQARILIDEAKKVHARLHMMKHADFKHPWSGSLSMSPMEPAMRGPNGFMGSFPYPYPKGDAPTDYASIAPEMLDARGDSSLPQMRYLGAGMLQPETTTTEFSQPRSAMNFPANMPRRRFVPSFT